MGVEVVDNYLDAIRKQDIEELGALILANSGEKIYTRFKVIGGDQVVGYDEKGHEVVRAPLKEPVYVRSRYDSERNLYLTNTP
ncbi:MAG: hypothetical protein ACO2O0_09450 [Desulfurococcales archaeon]|jgi:hypothetical protein